MTRIQLHYRTHVHPDTLDRLLTADAIDAETGEPVASYSLRMMAAWLARHGFEWETGSQGVWVRR